MPESGIIENAKAYPVAREGFIAKEGNFLTGWDLKCGSSKCTATARVSFDFKDESNKIDSFDIFLIKSWSGYCLKGQKYRIKTCVNAICEERSDMVPNDKISIDRYSLSFDCADTWRDNYRYCVLSISRNDL